MVSRSRHPLNPSLSSSIEFNFILAIETKTELANNGVSSLTLELFGLFDVIGVSFPCCVCPRLFVLFSFVDFGTRSVVSVALRVFWLRWLDTPEAHPTIRLIRKLPITSNPFASPLIPHEFRIPNSC